MSRRDRLTHSMVKLAYESILPDPKVERLEAFALLLVASTRERVPEGATDIATKGVVILCGGKGFVVLGVEPKPFRSGPDEHPS